MKNYIYSDIVFEDELFEFGKNNLSEYELCETEVCNVHRLKIENNEQIKKYNRPIGNYITISGNKFTELSDAEYDEMIFVLSREIKSIIAPHFGVSGAALIVGLGNPVMTADSLGPKTIDKIAPLHKKGNLKIYTVATDVFASTGINTFSHVKALREITQADTVVLIDSLVARSKMSLYSSVQITDAGISPGSGIGRARESIKLETLGVPVIAIGVPTVVSAATLACDALMKAGLTDLTKETKDALENQKNYFVTPGDADISVRVSALLLAEAIGSAFEGI